MSEEEIANIDDLFKDLNDMMKGFSYVKDAEERKDFEYNLNFGKLDKDQSLKVRTFWDEHDVKHGHYAGAIGGRYGWKIIPTSLGLITITYCSACKEEFNVTDFDSW